MRHFLQRTPWRPAPAWTEADARVLATFLQSAAGSKAVQLLTNEIAAANERAAMSRGSAWECGWACGYRGALAWLQSLATPAASHETEASGSGAGSPAGPLAHLNP